jgi:hypothetical protein
MLVYNIKRSINILGVSDLIAKLKKWNSATKKSLFCCITNYFRLLKTYRSDIFAAQKQFAVERLYCRLEYVLFAEIMRRTQLTFTLG